MSLTVSTGNWFATSWRTIWLTVGSILGLTSLWATFKGANVWDTAEHLTRNILHFEPAADIFIHIGDWALSASSVTSGLGTIAIVVGVLSAFLNDESAYSMPRTLGPATAWIGFTLLHPAGFWKCLSTLIFTAVIAVLMLVGRAIGSKGWPWLRTTVRLGLTDLLVALIFAPAALLTLAVSPASTKTSDSKPRSPGGDA